MSTSPAWLDPDTICFPDIERALDEPNGLLAIGGDLTTPRLLNAYRNGIFPWYNASHPILWWSPDPRCVLVPDHLHISHSLRKRIRLHDVEIWINRDFPAVVHHCAAPRSGCDETWINPAMISAYQQLHEQGLAHSIETWQRGKMVGGLYGVALGGLFCGESMFSAGTDASKLALVALCRHFSQQGGQLIDCQMPTRHLTRLGAEQWPRSRYLEALHQHCQKTTTTGCWDYQQIWL